MHSNDIIIFTLGEGLTILASKKKIIPIAKLELAHFLTAYQENPCSWPNILAKMMENLPSMPPGVQDLYKRLSVKQLKVRLSTKLGKLMATPLDKIKDDDIR